MSDIERLTQEEINNLSHEEKREFVRKLIHSEAAEVHAAFLNPETGQRVDMRELAERMGEEEAIDLIVTIMENPYSKAITMDSTQFKEFLAKAKRGECTDEELAMLQCIIDKSKEQDNIQFEHNFVDMACHIIHFSQKAVPYRPQLYDVLSSVAILSMISFEHDENGNLSKYKNAGDLLMEMSQQVANDIYDTWKASCTTLPNPEIIIMGLMQLACRIAAEENMEFPDIEPIAEELGVELEEIPEQNENGSPCNCNICQPATYTASEEDNEMRDLLKE